jgi:hypothetical protein
MNTFAMPCATERPSPCTRSLVWSYPCDDRTNECAQKQHDGRDQWPASDGRGDCPTGAFPTPNEEPAPAHWRPLGRP